MTIHRIGRLVLIFLLLIPVEAFSAAKLDPMFALMTRKGAGLEIAKRRGILKSVPETQEPVVKTLLRFRGDLSGAEALGAKVRSVLGDVATVDIPLSALESVSELSNVVYVEAPRKVRPLLNVSVPATGADLLRSGTPPNWTGNTGRNVVVGIVDTGLDLSHRDFKDASGKSRVLFVRFDDIFGSPGQECTGAQIDSLTCGQGDSVGHGTHVAGIAAGNGAATGNRLAAYRYVGMAPEADLIVVNLPSEGGTDDILDGIRYIQEKAAALGKPSVINLSLGSDLGSHDGTSIYERGIDNASGPGKIIVSSAGNGAQAAIHARGTVTTATPNTVELNIPPTSPEEILDIWYSGRDRMGIQVTNSNDPPCTTPVVSPGEIQINESCGVIIVSTDPQQEDPQLNGDLEIGVLIVGNGDYSFTLSGINISNGGGRFDAWVEFKGDVTNNVRFTNPSDVDPTMTLIDSATAARAIAVGAFATKRSWTSQGGPVADDSLTVSAIAPFSSRGPRRPCTNTAECPLVQKPEITAPGAWIMSALSRNTSLPDERELDPDDAHTVHEGTSMSAPHVTGAVALLLQANPTLTPEEIKDIFRRTASTDKFTGLVPNNIWGYGKLNVQAAFAATPNAPPSAPTGPTAAPGAEAVTLSWAANPELDLDGYNVYRSATSGTGYAKVAFVSHRSSSFTDTGLQDGIPYFYVLRSVDTAGQESGSSAEVSGVPNPNPNPNPNADPSGGGEGGCAIGSGPGDLILAAIGISALIGLGWRRWRGRVEKLLLR
jgi:subtilisin family serine protease